MKSDLRRWHAVAVCASLVVAASAAGACARSAKDRELDRMFAHQASLRDTTGAVGGTVIDGTTGRPLRGVFLSTQYLGDGTDSLGRFTIVYLPAGPTTVRAEDRGFLADSASAIVRVKDTVQVRIVLQRAPSPCCSLVGQWHIVLVLDSAGAGGKPTSRQTEGKLALTDKSPYAVRDLSLERDSLVRSTLGVFAIDLEPLGGSRVAPDEWATVSGSSSPWWLTEASAEQFDGDSLSITLIPSIDHGSVSLAGRLRGDTAIGLWSRNAYCCGASGHFRMVRTSVDPGPIVFPPPPKPPDTLAESERGEIRVRVWDDAANGYIRARHALELPDGAIQSSYAVGTEADGWGVWFWLAPGRYAIVLQEFPCGTESFFLKKEIRKRFEAFAGQHTEITLHVDTRSLQTARAYNTPQGQKCTVVPVAVAH